ncbi:hypothetical protein KI387_023837, partial [Taxus chinensis]
MEASFKGSVEMLFRCNILGIIDGCLNLFYLPNIESLLPTKQRNDSHKCVDDLQSALLNHIIHIPQCNDTCDTM